MQTEERLDDWEAFFRRHPKLTEFKDIWEDYARHPEWEEKSRGVPLELDVVAFITERFGAVFMESLEQFEQTRTLRFTTGSKDGTSSGLYCKVACKKDRSTKMAYGTEFPNGACEVRYMVTTG